MKIDPSFKPVARPVCDVSGVKVLYSHPQAWGQCKAFLSSYFKGVERRDVSSTSKAAEIVSADKSGESAALSSSVAAGVFGCDVLAEGVNDRVGNETRFLVIRRDDDGDGGGSEIVEVESGSGEESVRGGSGKVEDERDFKTLITFTVDHANPGALAECLAAFARYGLNLTSINTRPSGVENWNYIFFVELKSRKGRSKNGDGPVDKALKNLEGVCRALKWQGSWENRLDG